MAHLALAAIAAAALLAPAANAADARFEGNSAGGEKAFFSTTDRFVEGDSDNRLDTYVREFDTGLGAYITREVSLGPTGGNDAYSVQYLGADDTGDRVFFSTEERLTADDSDGATDIYVRDLEENKTQLVSACPQASCNSSIDAGAVPGGIVDEGDKVFFAGSGDIFVRDLVAETTVLVSAPDPSCVGSCGGGSNLAVFQGASVDGAKAIFKTSEALVGEDEDTESDLYERDLADAETKLASVSGSAPDACPAGVNCEPANGAISRNGSHVFFETSERVLPADTDTKQDVYDWSGGPVALVSLGPTGGNGSPDSRFVGSSASGAEVFFATVEPLVGADEDAVEDVYVRVGGATKLVSEGDPSCSPSDCGNGPKAALLQWVSADGSTAVLSTAEPLVAEDEDASADVYARTLPDGPTRLVSQPGPTCLDPKCGDGLHNASFAGASSDGAHLFFITAEALAPPEVEADPLSPGDRDEQTDVYDHSGGTTRLVSLGQLDEGGTYRGNGLFPTQLRAVSEAGERAFLTTKEQLTEADKDADEDVYSRSGGVTLLASRGNDAALEAELAPPAPTLKRTDPESPAASTTPRIIGMAEAGSSIKVYSTTDCSGEPIAIGTAEQLQGPGIAVSVEEESFTWFRATTEAEGFISACSAGISYEQSTPESEGGSESPQVDGKSGRPTVRISPAKEAHYVEPVTRITFGPAFKTRARRPVFRFTDATGQPGTHFLCKLDRGGWKPCGSPSKLKKLPLGKHAFSVRGVNALGVEEARPTKRSFKLVRG